MDLLGLSDRRLRLATSDGAFQHSLCRSAGGVGRMEAAAVGVGVPAEPATAARAARSRGGAVAVSMR